MRIALRIILDLDLADRLLEAQLSLVKKQMPVRRRVVIVVRAVRNAAVDFREYGKRNRCRSDVERRGELAEQSAVRIHFDCGSFFGIRPRFSRIQKCISVASSEKQSCVMQQARNLRDRLVNIRRLIKL